MSKGDKQQTSDVLRILHGARGLPPAEAAEALMPFLESMRKIDSDDALAHASIAAVTELARKPQGKPRRVGRSLARRHRGHAELCK
jgi:hypothetical protein